MEVLFWSGLSRDSFVLYLHRGELIHDLSEFSKQNFTLS